eukprot:TRINITY_DN8067_c0_g1_i4.p1 TRINITY_DN8067_c0_g1~~TRINITY_DN8067_c0_g1_i4.p1  ORF type:complete len:254 (-),score=36.87 TRINITY_DN8067_c0_g1_i4:499-1260(-)
MMKDSYEGEVPDEIATIEDKSENNDDMMEVHTPQNTLESETSQRKSGRTPKQKIIYEPDPNLIKSQVGLSLKRKKARVKCEVCLCLFTKENYEIHLERTKDVVETWNDKFKCLICPHAEIPPPYKNKGSWHSHKKHYHPDHGMGKGDAIVRLEKGQLVVKLGTGKTIHPKLELDSVKVVIKDHQMFCVIGEHEVKVSNYRANTDGTSTTKKQPVPKPPPLEKSQELPAERQEPMSDKMKSEEIDISYDPLFRP